MEKKNNAPFLSIAETSKATGVSQFAIRQMCREGKIPHIKSGVKYLVNLPAFLQMLDEQSQEAVR